jgi:hypothetical protein
MAGLGERENFNEFYHDGLRLYVVARPHFYRENTDGRDFFPFICVVKVLTEKHFVSKYHQINWLVICRMKSISPFFCVI